MIVNNMELNSDFEITSDSYVGGKVSGVPGRLRKTAKSSVRKSINSQKLVFFIQHNRVWGSNPNMFKAASKSNKPNAIINNGLYKNASVRLPCSKRCKAR